MKRLLVLLALVPVLLALNSCGSGAAAAPTISVSGAEASINVNGTVQFTAAIQNLSSTLVSWQVNSVPSGNATYGTINTNGLYTAPSTVPTNNVVTIVAVAQAQTSLTASTTLTVLPAASINSMTCVNPQTEIASTTVASGTSLLCTPQVLGGGNIAVYWYVTPAATCSATPAVLAPNAVLGGNSTVGVITGTQQGNYVGPQIPPPGAAVTLTAVSQADSTQALCTPVSLTFGNSSLQGSYTFSTSGRAITGNSFFARAGSFTANGSGSFTTSVPGGLIGGIEDEHSGVPISFTGSYLVGPDGRGTMQFCEPSTSGTCTAPTSYFRFVVVSVQQAQIVEYSSPTSGSAPTAASGEMDLEPDSSAFNNAGLNGTYTFSFAGTSATGTPQSEVGEFKANGLGAITSGELDINNGGEVTITGGSYTISANGRGTASIVTASGTSNFSFYMVSASHAKFVETDASAALAGDAFIQQIAPSIPWGPNALDGSVVFETAGSGPSGGIADLASFTADGAANFTSGTLDQNSGGAVTSTPSLSGTYTIDSTGRGTLTLPGHSYVFYMVASGAAVIQETTSGVVAHGSLVEPTGGPFTSASLQVSYAASLAGKNAGANEEDFVGQLTSNGAGTVTSGSLDINNFGATQTGLAIHGTYGPFAGSGRFTMLLSPTRNLVLYFVSPTQVFALDTDSTDIAIGSLYQQF